MVPTSQPEQRVEWSDEVGAVWGELSGLPDALPGLGWGGFLPPQAAHWRRCEWDPQELIERFPW